MPRSKSTSHQRQAARGRQLAVEPRLAAPYNTLRFELGLFCVDMCTHLSLRNSYSTGGITYTLT